MATFRDVRPDGLNRAWNLYAVDEAGERTLLNRAPFIGDCFGAGAEADRLSAEMDDVDELVLEVLTRLSQSTRVEIGCSE